MRLPREPRGSRLGLAAGDRTPHGQTRAAALGCGAPSEAAARSRRRRIYLGKRDKLLTVVSNLDTGEPLWAGLERKRETLDRFFAEALPPPRRRAVRAVCVDIVGTLRAEPAGPPAPRAPRLRQVPRPAACERRRRRDAAGRVLPQGRRGPRLAPGQALGGRLLGRPDAGCRVACVTSTSGLSRTSSPASAGRRS